MSNAIKVAVIIASRPDAIKLAPVVRELRQRSGIEPLLVSVSRHGEALAEVLDVFGLQADLDIKLTTQSQSLHDITCRTLARIQCMLRAHRPSWIVAQGDTTTALAAALAGFYEKIPLAHVEAGVRSEEQPAPFPEEMSPGLVDQLSELLFAPTELAREALFREGIPEANVILTGDTAEAAEAAHRIASALERWTFDVRVPSPPRKAAAVRSAVLPAR